MAKSICSRSYRKMSPDTLDEFAAGVRKAMADNPTVFTTPPVNDSDFHDLIDNFINTRAAFKNGGNAQKAPYEAAKTALIEDGLDPTADYVDEVADGNEDIILQGGYKPTKSSKTEPPAPAKANVLTVKRGETGEFYAECEKIDFAESYGCIVSNVALPTDLQFNAVGQLLIADGGNNPPTTGTNIVIFDMTKPRKKKFMGLTPGTTYYFYFYSVNATGVSPLSDGKSMMCA